MEIYKCKVGYGYMNEDELPKDLPDDVYDWWYKNSFVDGVRVGPIIEEVTTQPIANEKEEMMMEKTISYSEIKQVDYRFTIADITRALCSTFNIELDGRLKLELYEEVNDEPQYAELTVSYSKTKK